MSENQSPEFKEAYAKEMERLEAEANPETTSKVEPKIEQKVEPDKPEPVKAESANTEADQRFAKIEKALKDTQRWGHRNANEVARLQRELDEERHKKNRPAILDSNPGLEDAIAHVARVSEPKTDPAANWLNAVSTAIPDAEELLSNPEFLAKAQERKASVGTDWDNPLVAVRELSDLKIDHLRNKAVNSAVEQARKDFQVSANKRTAMQVPGGSGGQDSKVQTDEVKKVWDMSQEDFDKQRARVMGHR